MSWQDSALLTDLYQLTMLQTYVEHGMEDEAVFEFFIRRLPASRGFLLAAGLEQVLDFLEGLHFEPWELEWLSTAQHASPRVIDYLRALRFSGDVHAIPEGSVVFPHEPILRVTAPLPQAQLIETRLINLLHFQTLIASKAARLMLCAKGRPLIDFGLRRAHGGEAGLLAARAAYLAGMSGTATVLAGVRFGIPLYGTMAHSFIQAHPSEEAAFEAFADSHPTSAVFLIDTYDTERGAEVVVSLAPRLQQRGIVIKGVRLDSGDLAEHARKVRKILDAAGLRHVGIVASGNIDESRLRELVESRAPIDSYAVGTHLTTSADAPSLDCAYKLMAYAGRPRRKRSEGKATWPGRKQVYRYYDDDGRVRQDVLALVEEHQDGEALLQPVMRKGTRLGPAPTLAASRQHATAELGRLPLEIQQLVERRTVDVVISEPLRKLAAALDLESDSTSSLP